LGSERTADLDHPSAAGGERLPFGGFVGVQAFTDSPAASCATARMRASAAIINS
jgi:hypothetical protein